MSGEPIAKVLSGSPELLPVVLDLAQKAVQAIHAAGLVHGGLQATLRWAHGDVALPPASLVPRGTAQDDLMDLLDSIRRCRSSPRYERLEQLGTGGMGEVHRVSDRLIRREVAMKLTRPNPRDPKETLRRFHVEQRITAHLQHPGVVPIYDVGVGPDGRPFYTMKVVRGIELGRAIDRNESLVAMVDVLIRVCEAVGYAHAQGILHRDLKPSNVMLGPFGEVMVMDWGLAWAGPESTVDLADLGLPAHAQLAGTPIYMAPELLSAAGVALEPRQDIYSLGAVMYEMLTGHAPYEDQEPLQGFADLVLRRPTPPKVLAPLAPPHLLDLCRACMDAIPNQRPSSAEDLASELRRWLRGEERRSRAQQAFTEVSDLPEKLEAARGIAERLRRAATQHLANVPSWAPVEDKAHAWSLEEQASVADIDASALDARYEQGIRAALALDPDHGPANAALARVYRRRIEESEQRKDAREGAFYRSMLESHADGRYVGWLQESVSMSLASHPPATAILERFETVSRRLEAVHVADCGMTPIAAIKLQPGSYRFRLVRTDAPDVIYPVCIGRSGGLHGTPTKSPLTETIRLPSELQEPLQADFVPAGWMAFGGDERALDPAVPTRVWVDSFYIQRAPVTHGEYLGFLNGLVASQPELAARWVPTEPAGRVSQEARALYCVDSDGRYRPDQTVLPSGFREDWPVVMVSWFAACAYAQWWSSQEGRTWELPHEVAWEKAARGVDGRAYPWGDHLDGAFACTAISHEGAPGAASVTDYPLDEGPYGTRGMAGNVRDWCANTYEKGADVPRRVGADTPPGASDGFRVVRGGNFLSHSSACRAASRLVAKPHEQLGGLGFRLISWERH